MAFCAPFPSDTNCTEAGGGGSGRLKWTRTVMWKRWSDHAVLHAAATSHAPHLKAAAPSLQLHCDGQSHQQKLEVPQYKCSRLETCSPCALTSGAPRLPLALALCWKGVSGS